MKKLKKVMRKITKKITKPFKNGIKVLSAKIPVFDALVKKIQLVSRKARFRIACWRNPIDERLVVFEAFSGGKFACNPKALYEAMLESDEYQDFKFAWIVNNPRKFTELKQNRNTIVVKKFTKKHFETYAKGKYWINNMSVPDYLAPRKEQIYVETWHGTPLKKMGFDIETDVDPRQTQKKMREKYATKAQKMTYMLSASDFYTEKLTSSFGLDKFGKADIFIKEGYPRNDYLFHYTEKDVHAIKEKLEIPEGKKLILYAPTWRDTQYEDGKIVYNIEVDFEKLMNQLGDEYMILFRAHHHVRSVGEVEYPEGVLDVSQVEDVNELYVISDMLITDYSSTMFDYANLKRPMLFYMYDVEEYGQDIRGFYFDIQTLPGPIIKEEKELGQAILDLFQNFQYDSKYEAFNKKFNPLDDGESSLRSLARFIDVNVSEEYLRREEKNKIKAARKGKIRKQVKIILYNIWGFLRSMHICLDRNSRKLVSYKNKHKGKRCFLIGNGPSLTVDDLNLLKDEYCFGCNMIYKVYDQTEWRPTYHFAIDPLYIRHMSDELAENVTEQFFTNRSKYKLIKNKPKKTTFVNEVVKNPYRVNKNLLAYYVPSQGTVMTFMAEMAMFMGFEEIYLIGVDCTSTFNNNSYFIKGYKDQDLIDKELKYFRKKFKNKNLSEEDLFQYYTNNSFYAYEVLKEYADENGIKIYNATRGGALEVFERANLDEVVKQAK